MRACTCVHKHNFKTEKIYVQKNKIKQTLKELKYGVVFSKGHQVKLVQWDDLRKEREAEGMQALHTHPWLLHLSRVLLKVQPGKVLELTKMNLR